MKAIVLVAGYASRLYPLTQNKPKALLTLNGTTLIDFLMKKVEEVKEIDDVILVSNHKFYDQFCDWIKTYHGRLKLTVLDDGTTTNEDRLGAIGDTQYAIEKMHIDDEIMLLVSDNYFTFTLKELYDYHKQKNADVLLVSHFDDLEYLGKHFACVTVDENSKITGMVEKPGGIPNTDMGAWASYIYTKDSVKLIKTYLDEGNNKDAPGNFPAWLYKRKPIYAYAFKGECYDIGTIDVYRSLDEKLKKENVK